MKYPVRRGFTLIEFAIVLAVTAVLVTLAVPSMGRQLERHRLQAAAESLAADLTEARFEAARRGVALHLETRPGAGWCWAVTTAPGCSCEAAQACQLKTVRAEDHRGVRLLSANSVRFDTEGRADAAIGATLEAGGQRLRVDLSALGRARICDPEGHHSRLPRC
jgi:type IV fimbrial biogenesis protein FimT